MAWLFYAISIKTQNTAIITAITESYPSIAIMLGVIINKEQIKLHQWIGIAITIVFSLWLAITLV